jgi:mRNA-degrading endonuclease RelE of RelBE toxin-antitoxin system
MTRHGKNAPGTGRIIFTLSKKMKEELRALAKADRRTLSDYIRCVLEDSIPANRQRPPVVTHDKPC